MQDQFSARRNRLVQLIKKEGCNAVLITNFTNVTWLTGFTGDDSYLFLTDKNAILLSDARYTEQIKEQCPDLDFSIRKTGVSMIAAIKQIVDELLSNPKKPVLGVEGNSITLTKTSDLGEAIPEISLCSLIEPVEKLREIKDKYEIASMRAAIHATIRGFEMLRSSLRPEQTEVDLRNDLEYYMRKFGADTVSFPSIIAVGPRAALPHAVPTAQNKISDGELLLIDWGALVDHYCGDLTRVLITSPKPSDKLKKIYNIVLEAQLAAIDAIKPGLACCEIDAIARNHIAKAGYGNYFDHGLGHGLGLVVHDRGGFRPENKTILKPGMVLTVEPGIYIPGWGGIRIEDDVLITRSGCENLSAALPKTFEEMIVRM